MLDIYSCFVNYIKNYMINDHINSLNVNIIKMKNNKLLNLLR